MRKALFKYVFLLPRAVTLNIYKHTLAIHFTHQDKYIPHRKH